MANTFKFGNGNWAVKDGYALAYNDENNNFKPLPFDFTRASSATRVNKQGLIETVPSGKPRIDFLDNTSGHLLLEPSRTNSFQRSEEFDNGYWTKTNSTITANQIVSPDGTQNADTLTQSSAGGYLRKDVSFSGSETASFFVKANSVNFVALFSGGNEVYFDLINGAATSSSGSTLVSYKIDSYGNGWYRCSITTNYSGSSSIRLYPSQSNGAKDTTTGSVYVWGAQFEAGSYQTSYVKTEGSSVTRVAETCNGAGNSTVFNDSEGVLYAEIAALANDSTFRNICISDGGSSDKVQLYYRSTANEFTFLITAASVSQAFSTITLSNALQFNKIALKYKQNDFALWVNGVEVATVTSGNTPTGLSELAFDDGSGGSDFYGKAKDVRVYNTALTDTELQNLTS